jgi:hypothetical protein
MSPLTHEQMKIRDRWINCRAEEWLVIDRDERPADVWDFIRSQAAEAQLPDGSFMGIEDFSSSFSWTNSFLEQLYPNIVDSARVRLERQKKDKERRAQRKRKLDAERAAAGPAGGSAGGSAARERAGAGADDPLGAASLLEGPHDLVLLEKRKIVQYQAQIAALKAELSSARSVVADSSALLADAQAKRESAEAECLKLRADLEKNSCEHQRLLGRGTGLSESELDELLVVQHNAHDRTLKEFYKPQAIAKLEENPRFICSITGGLLSDPVVAVDGNTYERTAISQWIQEKLDYNSYNNQRNTWNSPLNGVSYNATGLVPNNDKKGEIVEQLETTVKHMIADRIEGIAKQLRT